MSDKPTLDLKFRKSKLKEDSKMIAKHLSAKHNISPYNVDELGDIINAALRSGEIIHTSGEKKYVEKDIEQWFETRLMPNTITLSYDDYKRALYRAFRLLVLGDLAKTDFGGSRQRDFGQRWTDFTRGFLGEIGIERFFAEKLNLIVSLDEKEIGEVEQFISTDLTKVKENGQWRKVKTHISIKTSKLPSMWLDIGSQIGHSDAFIFIKIGLTVDHLLTFMKETGVVKRLVDIGHQLGEVEKHEEELKSIFEKIADVKPFPTYISGFAWKSDLKNGTLQISSSSSGKKKIIGGIGEFLSGMATEVEGLGEITPPKHLASLGALRWSRHDWDELKEKI